MRLPPLIPILTQSLKCKRLAGGMGSNIARGQFSRGNDRVHVVSRQLC